MQPRSKQTKVALWILAFGTVSSSFFSYFSTGYFQQILIALASAFCGILLAKLVSEIETEGLPKVFRYFPQGLFVFFASTSIFFGYFYFSNILESRDPFPREDGLIADFKGGGGGPARSAWGGHFAIFSDSAFNQKSKIWYERLPDASQHGEGFLRIHYELSSEGHNDPYAGIFTDFSYPLTYPYDISNFRLLSIKLRTDPTFATQQVRLAITLYSMQSTTNEAFPTHYIQPNNLTTDWVSLEIPLGNFKAPPTSNKRVKLNSKEVYRIGVMVLGKAGKLTQGHVDIDEVKLR